jgi:PAP2 superfamily
MVAAVIRLAASWRRSAFLMVSCTVYATSAFVLAPALYLRNLNAFASQFLPAALVLCIFGLFAAAILRRPSAPFTQLTGILRHRSGGALAIAAGMCIGLAAFWTFKFEISRFVPFHVDRLLADVDQLLHFGDPWRWVHTMLPSSAMRPMLFVYFPAWLIGYFGCISLAAFHPSDRLRSRYLLSFAAIYLVLGNVLAAAGASVGPIFYDQVLGGSRFADLILTLKNNRGADLHFFIADRLFVAHTSGAEDIFAGISAMPSVHVAVATLNALFLMQIRRWLGVIGWTFTALTLLGSIYFGWHYAVDGYVSIAAVLLIWRTAGHFTANDGEGAR